MTAFIVSMETGEDELNVNSYGLRWSSHIPEQSEQVQMKTTWIITSTFIYTSLLLFLWLSLNLVSWLVFCAGVSWQ